jgi:transposase
MDNASLHKHPSVYETVREFRANILLNAQYSPWLNPVEQLFNYIKRQLRSRAKKPGR